MADAGAAGEVAGVAMVDVFPMGAPGPGSDEDDSAAREGMAVAASGNNESLLRMSLRCMLV